MSLPQRKKSAEEIAKLRESLGIPGQAPVSPEAGPVANEEPVTKDEPAVEASTEEVELPAPVVEEPVVNEAPVPEKSGASPESADKGETPAILQPLPPETDHDVKVVRSLKRSERIPVLPTVSDMPANEEETLPPRQASTTLPVMQSPKQVRSLRKSEQGPITVARDVPAPAKDSILPTHRRTDQELNEIRKREMLSNFSPNAAPKVLSAHLAIVIPGYLLAVGGGLSFYHYDFELVITAALAAGALLVAGLIFFRWPLSRHHAAFIAMLALFVIVFGTLHYFPQLRYGT